MSEWKEYKLNNFCKVGSSKRIFSSEYVPFGIPFFRSKEIIEKSFGESINELLFISEERFREIDSKLGSPKEGDILISSVGARSGIPYLVKKEDGKFYFKDGNLIWIKDFSENLDSNFLLYWFKSNIGQDSFESITIGSAQPALTIDGISNLCIKLPDIKTQKIIANILSCLDNKIDNLRRQNETLEKIAQTLFKHWFIDFEFPNDDGKPYKSSGGAMVTSELGDIPEGWRVGKLGEEVETVGGGTPSTTEPSYWENGDIYWYSPTDLTKSKTIFSLDTSKKITKLGLDKSSARLFPKYSILMTSRATIGEVTINTNYACTNQGFITLIPNSLFDTFYLFCWLKTQLTKVNLLASGSTFPELSKSDFRNFDFLIPSNHLVLGFRELVTPLFLRIETNTKQIQILTKTRDTLLPKLMNGQIRVKD
ncbi:MAG: restriction endonuclease subunit S [Planktothrix rubescens PR222]